MDIENIRVTAARAAVINKTVAQKYFKSMKEQLEFVLSILTAAERDGMCQGVYKICRYCGIAHKREEKDCCRNHQKSYNRRITEENENAAEKAAQKVREK